MYASSETYFHTPSFQQNGIVPSTHNDQLRVLFVNARTVNADRILEQFQATGAMVERSRLGAKANRDILSAEFDILVLHARDSEEISHHLDKWQGEGLKTPVIVVSEEGSNSISGIG